MLITTPGIYQIVNSVNQKRYIGYAKNPRRRWYAHLQKLSDNKHFNKHLQNAWNVDGRHNFEFSIIQECSINSLPYWEDYWAMILKVHNKEFGYNKRRTNPGGIFFEMSEVAKEKIANSHLYTKRKVPAKALENAVLANKGKKLSSERRILLQIAIEKSAELHRKKVIDISTQIIYNSCTEVSTLFNIKNLTLSRMLAGKYTNTTNFRYLNSDGTYKEVSTKKSKKIVSKETRLKLSASLKLQNRNMAGVNSPCYGKKQSAETINKRKETLSKIDLKAIHRRARGKCVKDINTGKVYSSVAEVAEVAGVLKSTLSKKLNGTRTNNTQYIYL